MPIMSFRLSAKTATFLRQRSVRVGTLARQLVEERARVIQLGEDLAAMREGSVELDRPLVEVLRDDRAAH